MLYKLKIMVVSILLMAILTTSCCFADVDAKVSVINRGEGLNPQYAVTQYVQAVLAFQGRKACADVLAQVDEGSADRMKVTVTLKKVGSSTPVKTWTDQIRMADSQGEIHFYEYYTVPSAGTYQFNAVGKIYKNNLVVDSFNISSYQVVCS